MAVTARTPNGDAVDATHATQTVGSSLRVVPEFVAETIDDDLGVQTSVTARYMEAEGRYVLRSVTHTVIRDDVEANYLTSYKVRLQGIIQEAAPQCIFVTLDDESDPLAHWLSVTELTTAKGRILPPAMAAVVVARGSKQSRMEAIELLYGSAALAGSPPVQLIASELGIPHRTASKWIEDARAAGRLKGMLYHAARPPRQK